MLASKVCIQHGWKQTKYKKVSLQSSSRIFRNSCQSMNTNEDDKHQILLVFHLNSRSVMIYYIYYIYILYIYTYYIYIMQASGEDLPLKYKKVPMSEAQWMNLLVGACPSTALDLFIFILIMLWEGDLGRDGSCFVFHTFSYLVGWV